MKPVMPTLTASSQGLQDETADDYADCGTDRDLEN
jgi:hypothetical protein